MKTVYGFSLLLGLLVANPVALAQDHQHPAGDVQALGQVAFSTSCAAEAQADFNRAVAMLHSFWYQAAEQAFVAITEQEPDCAMAYWGIAMSRFHQLWAHLSPESIRVGQAALQKAAAIEEKTARERAYVDALQQFYAVTDEPNHVKRKVAYETASVRWTGQPVLYRPLRLHYAAVRSDVMAEISAHVALSVDTCCVKSSVIRCIGPAMAMPYTSPPNRRVAATAITSATFSPVVTK